jgi:Uma2 family endonuclease
MSTNTPIADEEIVYPDSDGMPMAENTLQFQWIVTIKENLEALFRDDPDVFVAGDNLIYPVKGDNTIRLAPDALVAFGRPKGHRGSYKVWEEGGIFPQVVFEVLSPGNRFGEMKKKRQFFRRYGAEEYYVYDPDDNTLEGWLRQGRKLEEIDDMNGFISPRLRIRFDSSGPELVIYRPDGEKFLTFQEVADRAAAAEKQAARAKQENERLRAMLRAAGIDPDKPTG